MGSAGHGIARSELVLVWVWFGVLGVLGWGDACLVCIKCIAFSNEHTFGIK